MPRFAANLSFADVPFLAFLARARAGVEFLFPASGRLSKSPAGWRRAVSRWCCSIFPGDWAAGERVWLATRARGEEFAAGWETASNACVLGCRRLHCLCRPDPPGVRAERSAPPTSKPPAMPLTERRPWGDGDDRGHQSRIDMPGYWPRYPGLRLCAGRGNRSSQSACPVRYLPRLVMETIRD